ncbi:MAG TPA: hypothetical protein VEK84_15805 [Terriglobales bacterium]|nr:hypothetical protein [Terriglobales bacterium]
MPTIIQFIVPASLVLASLLICLAFVTTRGFLIEVAVLSAIGGDGWAFHRYGLYGMPNILYFLIPAAVILVCVFIYLSSTNIRGFLLFGALLAAFAGACWLLKIIAPAVGTLLVIGFILGARCQRHGSGSLFKAFVVHSAVPDISVGEAYMASEADLI